MLGKVALLFTAVVLALAWLLSCPSLPDEVEDRYRTMIIVRLLTIIQFYPSKVKEYLGYGSFYNRFSEMQEPIYLEGPVSSAGLGVLNVTRATIQGVPVILYQPKTMSGLYPGLIYIHGGGFTVGSADVNDYVAHDHALCTGAVVISVNYRRAPQHPYPVPLNDVFIVTSYVLRHGQKYGIDVKRVGVIGESAGGNLAASVALKVTRLNDFKSDLPPLRMQVLLHPTLQAFDMRLPAYINNAEVIHHLPAKVMATFTAMYLGLGEKNGNYASKVIMENRHICPEMRKNSTYARYVDVEKLPEEFQRAKRFYTIKEPCDREIFEKIKYKVVDPYFSPLMAPDLSGLPPTAVVVAEFDVLRDDGLLYARRLEEAGVDTEMFLSKGVHVDMLKLFPDWIIPNHGKRTDEQVCEFMKKKL